MKTAKEILGKSVNGLRQQSWTSTTQTGNPSNTYQNQHQNQHQNQGANEISDKTKSLINMVFTRFMAIYGHKFKSSFETEAEMRIAKREWALSLASYNEVELVAAVSRCKESLAWAPSISEFLAILQELNDEFGLPDVRSAYREACMFAAEPTKHQWSHPVVYQAGRETGWFELRSEEEKQTFSLFSYHYEILCRRFRSGESMQEPIVSAIENKQDNTVCEFILNWSIEQGLSPEQGSSLLYYMMKPKGSRVRSKYRHVSAEKIAELGLKIVLPE